MPEVFNLPDEIYVYISVRSSAERIRYGFSSVPSPSHGIFSVTVISIEVFRIPYVIYTLVSERASVSAGEYVYPLISSRFPSLYIAVTFIP